MTVEEILNRFDGVISNGIGWKVLCPAHRDWNPSLAIAVGESGNVVMKCHAGCKTETILEKVGLTWADLCTGNGTHTVARSRPKRTVSPYAHDTYRQLIKNNPLNVADRENLLGRGLTDEVIRRNEYGSLTFDGAMLTIEQVQAIIGHVSLQKVPGFKREGGGWTNTVRHDGMMIPARDVNGRIQAIQLRVDEPSKKYVWFSSSDNSSGAPIHVPLHPHGHVKMVRVTEGPLKADIATALDPSILTIAIPSISTTRGLSDVLKQIGAETVVLALDADWQKPPASYDAGRPVLYAVNSLYRQLHEDGYRVELDLWNLADAKGIDDLLAKGRQPERFPMQRQLLQDSTTGKWKWW